jgi:hypothetical protein
MGIVILVIQSPMRKLNASYSGHPAKAVKMLLISDREVLL